MAIKTIITVVLLMGFITMFFVGMNGIQNETSKLTGLATQEIIVEKEIVNATGIDIEPPKKPTFRVE